MIIFSIIGALIGAGFASGQEMYLFFYKYGICGILGLVLCSSLIGLIIYKTFLTIYKNKKINNYHDFLCELGNGDGSLFPNFGKREPSPFPISHISNTIVNIFLLITFYIMIAGFGAYFEQEFQINKLIGAGILAILSYFILIKDIEGVAKTNSIIVPILILVIITIGIQNLRKIDFNNISTEMSYNWIIQAIVYSSYNMILVMPVLVGLKKYIKSKKQIIIISILSSLIVFILAISVFFLLTNINSDIKNIEMPAVYAITNSFPEFRWIYGIVILLSIFSTAISIGISFLKNTIKEKNKYPQIVSIMCISGVLISNIGFSKLVAMLFPVFGYLGIIQILFLIIKK